MRRTLLLLSALSLVVAACSGGDSSETTTTTTPAETTTTSQMSTTTTEESTTTTGATASGGGDGCLVGDWVLDDEAFFEAVFEAFGEGAGGGFEFVPGEGNFTVSFSPDGTTSAVRDGWGFTVKSDDGDFKIVINGDQAGTWETEGSTLVLNLEESTNFEITTSLVVDGQEVALPEAPFDVPADALSAASEYSCNGNTLTVITDEFTSEFVRS